MPQVPHSPADSMSTPPPSAWGSHPAGAQEAQNPLFQKQGGLPCSATPRRPFSRFGGGQRDKSHVDDYGSIGVARASGTGEPWRGPRPENPERLPDQVHSTFDELSDMVIAPREAIRDSGRGQGSRCIRPPGTDPVGRAGGAGQHPHDAGADQTAVRGSGQQHEAS